MCLLDTDLEKSVFPFSREQNSLCCLLMNRGLCVFFLFSWNVGSLNGACPEIQAMRLNQCYLNVSLRTSCAKWRNSCAYCAQLLPIDGTLKFLAICNTCI